MKIFNFGHPLSKKAADQLDEQLGANQVIWQHTAVDLAGDVKSQVYEMCHSLVERHGQPDYVILPGLAVAAVYIDRFFSKPEDDYPPVTTYVKLIRLIMEPDTTPPVFVVGAIE